MTVCIVTFSADGHTRAMADAIARGSGGLVLDVTKLTERDWQNSIKPALS